MRPLPRFLRIRPNLNNPRLHSKHKPFHQYIRGEHLNEEYHDNGRDDDSRLKPLIILHADPILRSRYIHHINEQRKEPQCEQKQYKEQ